MTISTTVNLPPIVAPKRGGIHSTYGVFIGGAQLDDSYKLLPNQSAYCFSTQRQHEKTIASIEQKLRDTRDSAIAVMFNGQLEATAGLSTEVGKEKFITMIKEKVKEHGQQTFYAIKDCDGTVVDLFEHSHWFKLETVIAEFDRQTDENNLNFESFDQYELEDVELSCMLVLSLLTSTFQEKLEIRFDHHPDFEYLSGACLFIMALKTCNASVAHDVEGAQKNLETLTLDSYPGENITDFTSEAQRLIKIMQGDYALPINTGSKLIQKVTKTSCEYFNQKMYTLLDKVRTLEHDIKLSDPKTLTKDPKYAKLGPLGIIATLQAAHGALLSELDWPALASKLPEANALINSVQSGITSQTCYSCGGNHLVCDCPQPQPGTANLNNRYKQVALADWKYVKPVNITTTKTDNLGRVWKFCTKCKCRATNKVGHYQLSHLDSNHIENYRAHQQAAVTTTHAVSSPLITTTTNSMTEVAPPDTPQSNLTAVVNPNLVPQGPPDVTTPAPTDADDFDDMTFTGAWCAPVNYNIDADATVQGYFPTPTSFNQHKLSEVIKPTSVIERENVVESTTGINNGIDNKMLSVSRPTQLMLLMMRILFWFSAMFWDTIAYFVLSSPADTPVRKQRRRKHKNILIMFTFAPASLMILTHSILLLAGTYQSFNLPTFNTFYAIISN